MAKVSVAPTPTPNPPETSVDRLAVALIEALGARAEPVPRSTDAIAARLLSESDDTSTVNATARGRALGQAWATDAARLSELEDLAAIADRDEWTALALGDGHSLLAFLAERGAIATADPAPSDLERDDFTTGLLEGAATVYRDVVPSLLSRRRLG